MPAAARRITHADLLPLDVYGQERKARRAALIPTKKLRRVELGPFCTFAFENYETMWLQVQEMLFIEKGGDAQIEDELSAYNPLIPQGRELIATMMIEIEDAVRRAQTLAKLGGIENHVVLELGSQRIPAIPSDDAERTNEAGKTSSVHFFRFPLTEDQARAWKAGTRAVLAIEHPQYQHMAVIAPATQSELAKDLA